MKTIYKITFLLTLTFNYLNGQTLDLAVSKSLKVGYSHMPFDMKESNFSDANFILGQSYETALNAGVLFQISPVYTFLCKVNSVGDTLWKWSNTTTATGSGSALLPIAMAIDNDDNIYITGNYSMNAVGLTMSIGNNLMPTSPIYRGGYIAKFDSLGNIKWVQGISASMHYNDMDIDEDGNLYLLGNTGSGVTYGGTTIHNSSSNLFRDYIVSFDSAGAFRWVQGLGEIDLNNTTLSQQGALLKLVVDKGLSPNIYAAGFFLATYDANGNTFTSAGAEDALILKLDNNGNFIKGMNLGSTNPEVIYDMQVNSNSEIVLGTSYRFGTSINGSTFTSAGWNTMLIKIDTALNYKFVKKTISSALKPVVAIDDFGRSAIVVGNYFGSPTSTFDYLQVCDSTGALLFTKSVTGAGTVSLANLNFRAVLFPKQNTNKLYLAGNYKPSMLIDGINLSCIQNNNFDIALLKFSLPSNVSTGTLQLSNKQELLIYPNPIISQFTISFNEEQRNSKIKIVDILGKEIKSFHFTGKQLIIDKVEMRSGIYFVKIEDENSNIITKRVVINSSDK